MINILNTELFRLKKSKLFWALLICCAALPILSLLLTLGLTGLIESILESIDGTENMDILQLLKEMDLTNLALQEFSSLLNNPSLLALICTGVVLSKEFTDGTVRNVILANKSRKQLYFAYWIISMIVGVTYLLASFAVILILYAPIYGFGQSTAGEAASAVFCSLALGLLTVAFAESCVCMFLFTVRKQWATVLLPLLVCAIAPSIINTVVTIIIAVMGLNGQTVSQVALSWIPLVNAQLYNPAQIDGGLVGKIAMYYALITGGFIALGYFGFEKADLK